MKIDAGKVIIYIAFFLLACYWAFVIGGWISEAIN